MRVGSDHPATGVSFAARYARLVDYGSRPSVPDPVDPAAVLAMPIALDVPRRDVPGRLPLAAAAARASVLLCLDERADDDGPWGPAVAAWCDARIRKIARRGRGARWDAAQAVPGVTVEIGTARARAIVPGPVGEVDPRIARMQIGGTEVPDDGESPPGPVTLWVNPGLAMSAGKLAAQAGHGAMLAVRLFDIVEAQEWFAAECPLGVAVASPARWNELAGRRDVAAVRDAGYTEIAPGSVTVIAARSGPLRG